MKALTYHGPHHVQVENVPDPGVEQADDIILRITATAICGSDLHLYRGKIPQVKHGDIFGHEFMGEVVETGKDVKNLQKGDRVVIPFVIACGDCFFCRLQQYAACENTNAGKGAALNKKQIPAPAALFGYSHLYGGVPGGQAEYVRVPHADQGLTPIPDTVSDEQALFVGDILATGFWAARISEIGPEDTVLVIGAGPTGVCTLLCAMLKRPRRIIVCEKSPERMRFVREHYPDVLVTGPETCRDFVLRHSDHGGADVVLEVAVTSDTFRLAWECARPNAVVTVVALYDEPQVLPLPDMYGKNLTFKTGGVDGCDCAEILRLIAAGKIDTTPLITHRFPLSRIGEAYRLFETRSDGVVKVAVECGK